MTTNSIPDSRVRSLASSTVLVSIDCKHHIIRRHTGLMCTDKFQADAPITPEDVVWVRDKIAEVRAALTDSHSAA